MGKGKWTETKHRKQHVMAVRRQTGGSIGEAQEPEVEGIHLTDKVGGEYVAPTVIGPCFPTQGQAWTLPYRIPVQLLGIQKHILQPRCVHFSTHKRRWTKPTFGCCHKNEAVMYIHWAPCWPIKKVTANTSKHDKNNKVQSHRYIPQYWGLINMPKHISLHIKEKHKQTNAH